MNEYKFTKYIEWNKCLVFAGLCCTIGVVVGAISTLLCLI